MTLSLPDMVLIEPRRRVLYRHTSIREWGREKLTERQSLCWLAFLIGVVLVAW